MTRYHKGINGRTPFTAKEEAEEDAAVVVKTAAKPLNDWKSSMQGTDDGMPRFLEDLITENPSLTIHKNMKTRYDEKVALRATKP